MSTRWQSSRDTDPQEAGLHAKQERFEITPTENKNDDGREDASWANANDARITRPIAGGSLGWEAGELNRTPNRVASSFKMGPVAKAAAENNPPNWTDQREQVVAEDQMPLNIGSDYADMTARQLASGFAYRPMSPTVDNKTGSEFHEKVRGRDDAGNRVTGFHERKPVLDRE
jgi:hypothetical protein